MRYNKDIKQEQSKEELLRKRLNASGNAAPQEDLDEVWMRISATLASATSKPKQHKVYALPILRVAAAVLAVLGVGLSIWVGMDKTLQRQYNSTSEVAAVIEEPSRHSTEPKHVYSEEENQINSAKHERNAQALRGDTHPQSLREESQQMKELFKSSMTAPDKHDEESLSNVEEQTTNRANSEETIVVQGSKEEIQPQPLQAVATIRSAKEEEENKDLSIRASFLAYASGSRSIGTASMSSGGMFLMKGTNGTAFNSERDVSALLYEQAEFRHDIPIKFGVNALLQVGRYLGFEFGVNYSYLHSKVSLDQHGMHWEQSQNVHYLGLPIGFRITAYQNESISLYVGAAGELDKVISATLNGTTLGTLPWSWSLHGRAGATVRLSSLLSLYVEPSLSYYFKDGTPLKTYYNQNPLALTISVGLLFTPPMHF